MGELASSKHLNKAMESMFSFDKIQLSNSALANAKSKKASKEVELYMKLMTSALARALLPQFCCTRRHL